MGSGESVADWVANVRAAGEATVGRGRPEEFEALAGRCAVFRLDGIQ
jgi:hypothetical protein